MTMDEVEDRIGGCERPVHRALYDCTRMWAPARGRKPGPVLYDLAPLFWLADEDSVRGRRSNVRVELEGAYTRGMTVELGGEGNVELSTDLDGRGLVREFHRIVVGA
jgi:inosine-uridine nucleoside N-ribohydrolase